MLTNPFKYGSDIPTGKYFANRKKEKADLIRDMQSGMRVLLFSLRRYGKSALIHNVLLDLEKKGFITAYIDFSKITDKSSLINKYKSLFARGAYKQWFLSWAQKFLSGVKIQYGDLTLDLSGLSEIEVDKTLENIIDLPENLSNNKKKKVVIAFDEFQAIAALDGEKIENLMRSNIQFHKNVSYIFSGSKHHILLNMFETPAKPFYKSAKIMELKKIPETEYDSFIKKRFSETGIKIEGSLIEKILNETENHTYYVQQLCHEIWDACKVNNATQVDEHHFEMAFDSVLSNQDSIFQFTWDSLASGYKRFLKGILICNNSIWSNEFKQITNLTEGGIQYAFQFLSKNYIIEKTDGVVVIPDVFFKAWMKKNVLT